MNRRLGYALLITGVLLVSLSFLVDIIGLGKKGIQAAQIGGILAGLFLGLVGWGLHSLPENDWGRKAIKIDTRLGTLTAVGSAEQPITFQTAGDVGLPGGWEGLEVGVAVLKYVQIFDTGRVAVRADRAGSAEIAFSEMHNCGWSCIRAGDGDWIHHNLFESGEHQALLLRDSALAEHNRIHKSNTGIVFEDAAGAVARNNIVTNSTAGIVLRSGKLATVANNTVVTVDSEDSGNLYPGSEVYPDGYAGEGPLPMLKSPAGMYISVLPSTHFIVSPLCGPDRFTGTNVAVGSAAVAQTLETHSFLNLNRAIPDGNASGLSDRRTITSAIASIAGLRVKLRLNGEFNGDLYGYVRLVSGNSTNFCVLLNRVGRTAANAWGFDDSAFNVTFDDAAANGNIHVYQNVTVPPAGTSLTGSWRPDGRDVDPSVFLDTSPSTTSLAAFNGANPGGDWTLFLADVDSGATNLLAGWELEISGGAVPAVTWPTPADIVYGTPLSATQLSASSHVPGSFADSPPAGTVLNAD